MKVHKCRHKKEIDGRWYCMEKGGKASPKQPIKPGSPCSSWHSGDFKRLSFNSHGKRCYDPVPELDEILGIGEKSESTKQ